MNTNEKHMLTALEFARDALQTLCNHHAFADDAPEFNEGGVGYIASKLVNEAIRLAQVEGNATKDQFALFAPTFGLVADDFGRQFSFGKNLYKIVGCSPKSFKFPVLAARIPDGKTFKFKVDDVKKTLGAI